MIDAPIKCVAPSLPPLPIPESGAEVRHVEGCLGYAVDMEATVYFCRGVGFGAGTFVAWRTVKPYFNAKKGYFYVHLSVSGEVSRFCLHSLVLRTFVGPRPEVAEGCHNDGNTRNNSLSNLRYDTKLNNEADKLRHGSHQFGERNPSAKLTDAQAEEVRRLRASGLPLKVVAAMFGIRISTVSRIANGVRRRT